MNIRYRTPWSSATDSWAKAARGYARAMKMAGMKVWLDSPYSGEQPEQLQWRNIDDGVLHEVEGMLPPLSGPYVTVLSTTLGAGRDFAEGIQRFADRSTRPRVLYTTFEQGLLNLRADLVAPMNRLDGIWVPSSFNAEALVRAGVDRSKILVAGHVFFDDDPLLQVQPRRPTRPVRFYWIGRWEPRKAPHLLLDAFLEEFEPDEASLTLKVGPVPWTGDYPVPVGGRDGVFVVHGALSRDEMFRLHADHDVYCSASHGEGWDLSAFEAKLAGHSVVTTDSGGPRDFLGPCDFIVPIEGFEPVEPGYEHWGSGAEWRAFDVEQLRIALRAAYLQWLNAGEPCAHDMSRFHAARVGHKLATWFGRMM